MKRYFREPNFIRCSSSGDYSSEFFPGMTLGGYSDTVFEISDFDRFVTEHMDIARGYSPLISELSTRPLFLKMINNEMSHDREIESVFNFPSKLCPDEEPNLWIREKNKLYVIRFSEEQYLIDEYLIKKDEKGIYPELQATIRISNMKDKFYDSEIISKVEYPNESEEEIDLIRMRGISVYEITKTKRYVRGNEVFEETFKRSRYEKSDLNKKRDVLKLIMK